MKIEIRDLLTDPMFTGLILILFLAAGLAGEAKGTLIDLAATRDATIYSQAGGDAFANGAGDSLIAGRTAGGATRRSLISFDVSGISAGSTITTVTLSLFMDQTLLPAAQVVSLHRSRTDWAEGPNDAAGPSANEGVGIAAVAGDVTFVSANKGTSLWTAFGGDFEGSASASLSVGDEGLLYNWTGAGLVSDVQGWVDGLTSNFGWFIIGNEASSATAKRFASRQHDSASVVPVSLPNLHIEFEPPVIVTPEVPAISVVPEPSTILLLGSGLLGFGLLRRQRRRPH